MTRRTLRPELSEKEKVIVRMRKDGYTYKQIAEKFGYPSYQNPQGIYYRALDKLRKWQYIEKNDPELIEAAECAGLRFDQLLRIYNCLLRNKVFRNYKSMSEAELRNLDGIGDLYLNVLLDSKWLSEHNRVL